MELGELRLRLRRDYIDDAVAPYLWSDEAVTDFINDAVRQVCLRQRSLIESVNTSVASYAVAASARGIKLHPSVLAVRFARFDGEEPLTGMTTKRMSKLDPCWEMADAGCPQYWIPDYQDGWLYFDCPRADAGTLKLSVWRTPLDSEVLEDDGDEPVVAQHLHIDLLDWAAYRAFNVKDSEAYDEQRANRAAQAFDTKIGRLPSMTEIRLWGISPIVGVPAEFL